MSRGKLTNASVPVLFVLSGSTAFVVGAIGVGAAPALTLVSSRFVIATVLLAAFALAVRAPWPRGRALAHIVVAGLLLQAVEFGGIYLGLKLGVPAALSALMICLNPVATTVLARPLLRESVSPRQWVGLLVGVLGVALALFPHVHLSGAEVGGVAFTLLGLAGLTGGTIYQKKYCPRFDLRTGTTIQLGVSALVLAPLAWVVEGFHVSAPGTFAGAVLWLALANSVGTTILLSVMIRRYTAGRVSTVFLPIPSVTAVMAAVALHQRIDALTIIGMVVTATGVAVATRRTRSVPRHSHPRKPFVPQRAG